MNANRLRKKNVLIQKTQNKVIEEKKPSEKRQRVFLRFLIDYKQLLVIAAGIFGIFLLPIYIFPFLTSSEAFIEALERKGIRYTLFIFIMQLIWITTIFSFIVYYLRVEKHRKS
ncbi:MAG TPA: hypothetical protein VK338_00270 [Candidatus Nitrosocosmicus sp.]|nr:hypothetical protein [Candidatus Nitrosocosmicus sp.]